MYQYSSYVHLLVLSVLKVNDLLIVPFCRLSSLTVPLVPSLKPFLSAVTRSVTGIPFLGLVVRRGNPIEPFQRHQSRACLHPM